MTVLLKGIHTFVYVIKFILGEKTLSIKVFKRKFHLQKELAISAQVSIPPPPWNRTPQDGDSLSQEGGVAQGQSWGPQSHHLYSDKTEPVSSTASLISKSVAILWRL